MKIETQTGPQGYVGPPDPGRQQQDAAIQRRLRIRPGKPGAPRGLRMANSALVWNPPQNPVGITHYRIYANNEHNLVRSVPAAQTSLGDPRVSGSVFFVTSYNANNQSESSRALYGPLRTPVTLGGDNQRNLSEFGAVGDGRFVLDANVGGSDVTSVTANFSTADVGKLIICVGAGVSGKDLTTTIATWVSPTHVTLTTAASTPITPTRAEWGTDNTTALLNAIASASAILIPTGRFLFSAQLPIKDRIGFKLEGYGQASVLVPTSLLANNLIDVSGSQDMELCHFQIDAIYFPDLSLEILYGDGTAANGTYGRIRAHNLYVYNARPLCFGIGANTPHTVQDISYEDNWFVNCGYGSFGANTIDTGSSGNKYRFKIHRNRLVFVTQPTTAPGNGIFIGHGVDYDFDVTQNTIVNCPSTGIAILKPSLRWRGDGLPKRAGLRERDRLSEVERDIELWSLAGIDL
jgi:hypothetical protein